ncbi:hypothetical protein FSARC_5769 [Fusarium sarcochroum]|uniref:LYR motif-containing protein Cup1-like N-terminal domain-containing protein n=1 Tax=Fusarium sarcochroum TaxID=1208366 RepID=A0A8H4X964_9HYPO|nr:hypothetical protein FSARC_5769 [Fusarium sarcochroum]
MAMRRPHTNPPAFLPPLHLYRNLIRESSYLPPAFGPIVASLIRTRFRSHRKPNRLQNAHLAKAAQALRKITAANMGDRKHMESLMMQAFGRIGPRRRSLFSDLVKIQPNDSNALEALINDADADADKKSPNGNTAKPPKTTNRDKSSPSKSEAKNAEAIPTEEQQTKTTSPRVRGKPKPLKPPFYEKWNTAKLRRLFLAQRNLQRESILPWPKRDHKTLSPDSQVPLKDIWGKPPSERIIQAKRVDFWKRTMTKGVPPVPYSEWELLGRLAKGLQEEDEWKIPERRPAAKPIHATEPKSSALGWNWEEHAALPVRKIERKRHSFTLPFLEHVPSGTEPYKPRYKQAVLSPRWFRRAYLRVWQMTPTENPKLEKDAYIFGSLSSPRIRPTKAQLKIFEGVDSKGKKLATSPPPVTARKS